MDAGNTNRHGLHHTHIAVVHRIMYRAKSLSLDPGAYEYYTNEPKPRPGAGEAALTWSSFPDKTYSIFYANNLVTWHVADDRVLSAGNMTTSWTDDSSKTGLPPLLVKQRFCRILENR